MHVAIKVCNKECVWAWGVCGGTQWGRSRESDTVRSSGLFNLKQKTLTPILKITLIFHMKTITLVLQLRWLSLFILLTGELDSCYIPAFPQLPWDILVNSLELLSVHVGLCKHSLWHLMCTVLYNASSFIPWVQTSWMCLIFRYGIVRFISPSIT